MSQTASIRFDYAKAYRAYNDVEGPDKSANASYEARLASLLDYVLQCLQQRNYESLLTSNEQFHEMTNEQLYAVLLEFYLAMCIPQQRFANFERPKSMQLRIKMLQEADAFHTEFLDRMEIIGLISGKQRKEQYEQMDSKKYAVNRDVKIERFNRQRELEDSLKQSQTLYAEITRSRSKLKDQEACDEHEEKERQILLSFLELAVIKSLTDQSANKQERDMLESITAMDLSIENDVVPQNQGITVTRITPQFEMKREVIRSSVFQPGHRLPTVSLAQHAEEQLQEAKERDERQRNAPTPPRRIEQLEEDGDEDDTQLVDQATLKDRDWDDWKDANPRGIGRPLWKRSMKTFRIIFCVAAILFFTALSGILISDTMLHDDEITSEDPLQEIINAPYASLDTKRLFDGETRYFRKEVEAGDPFDMRDAD